MSQTVYSPLGSKLPSTWRVVLAVISVLVFVAIYFWAGYEAGETSAYKKVERQLEKELSKNLPKGYRILGPDGKCPSGYELTADPRYDFSSPDPIPNACLSKQSPEYTRGFHD